MSTKRLIVLFVVVQCSFVPVAFANSDRTSAPVPDSLIITEVTVANPQAAQQYRPVDVLIEKGRITRIGKNLEASLAEGTPLIEGKGKFLAPGLIDSHTHLSDIPGMTAQQEKAFPAIAQMARQQMPLSYLYFGFTTLIDLNSSGQYIAQWNAQTLRPQAYFCGIAPVMDGYPTYFIPEQYRYQAVPNFIVGPSHRDKFTTDDEYQLHRPKAVVTRIKQEGAICVKSHYESGFGGHGDWPVPSQALLTELVSQAHQLNLPVLLHANSQQAQK